MIHCKAVCGAKIEGRKVHIHIHNIILLISDNRYAVNNLFVYVDIIVYYCNCYHETDDVHQFASLQQSTLPMIMALITVNCFNK